MPVEPLESTVVSVVLLFIEFFIYLAPKMLRCKKKKKSLKVVLTAYLKLTIIISQIIVEYYCYYVFIIVIRYRGASGVQRAVSLPGLTVGHMVDHRWENSGTTSRPSLLQNQQVESSQ